VNASLNVGGASPVTISSAVQIANKVIFALGGWNNIKWIFSEVSSDLGNAAAMQSRVGGQFGSLIGRHRFHEPALLCHQRRC